MKYLFIILLCLGCKKEAPKQDVITWKLTKGAGDVMITEGGTTTFIQACSTGWSQSTNYKPKTRYTIWTNAKKYHEVQILLNGVTVAKDSIMAAYE